MWLQLWQGAYIYGVRGGLGETIGSPLSLSVKMLSLGEETILFVSNVLHISLIYSSSVVVKRKKNYPDWWLFNIRLAVTVISFRRLFNLLGNVKRNFLTITIFISEITLSQWVWPYTFNLLEYSSSKKI